MSAIDSDIVLRAASAIGGSVCPCCHRPLPNRTGVAALAIAAADAVYGIDLPNLRARRGDAVAVTARALVAWALRTIGEPLSYAVIGRILGNRDHTTVIYLHRKAIGLRVTDPEFALACRAMEIAEETGGLYASS